MCEAEAEAGEAIEAGKMAINVFRATISQSHSQPPIRFLSSTRSRIDETIKKRKTVLSCSPSELKPTRYANLCFLVLNHVYFLRVSSMVSFTREFISISEIIGQMYLFLLGLTSFHILKRY